jgi:hypothetical protein
MRPRDALPGPVHRHLQHGRQKTHRPLATRGDRGFAAEQPNTDGIDVMQDTARGHAFEESQHPEIERIDRGRPEAQQLMVPGGMTHEVDGHRGDMWSGRLDLERVHHALQRGDDERIRRACHGLRDGFQRAGGHDIE